jgi:hypothetical protein
MNFLCLSMCIFFSSFVMSLDLHPFEVLYNKWCSSNYVCIVWNKMIKKISESKKKKDIIFSLMFFFFLTKKLFWYVFW